MATSASLLTLEKFRGRYAGAKPGVLSPDDRMQHIHRKCREYARIGIPAIFVFNPEDEIDWVWSRDAQNLERVEEPQLPNGTVIATQEIWEELQQRQ